MKVPKAYLGRVVSLQWMDPTFTRVELPSPLKGREALSTWLEYGMIDDITDGVVRIVHSSARKCGSDETDELAFTGIPEALIERITLYEPQPGVEEVK